MPFMYGIVAAFVGVALSLVSVVVVVVVVFFFGSTLSRYLFSSDKLSVVLHTSCTRRLTILIVVALCDVGLLDDSSSKLSVSVGFP